MRALLLLILLVPATAAGQEKKAAEEPTLAVVKFSLKRDRRYTGGYPARPAVIDAPIAGDTSRKGRSASAGMPGETRPSSRLPGEASIEEQSGAMRQAEASARRTGAYSAQEFYKYKVKLMNTDAREVRAVYWSFETRQSLRPDDVARREFYCSGKIKPGKGREFVAEAPKAPSLTVGADTAAGPDQVVINRVEYKDGTVWQRPGWSHYPVTWRLFGECSEIPSAERR